MKRFNLVFTLGIMLILSSVSWGDIPRLINFQGVLTNSGGTPLDDTTVNVMFAIYGSSGGSDSFWTETQSVGTDSEGRFNALLGSVTPVPDTAFTGTSRWLGIKVENDAEITPRQRLVSVAYSLRVAHFIPDFGTENTFIGRNAGNLTTSGFGYNTAIGTRSLENNTTGFANTASGASALHNNTGGSSNTASGVSALYSNSSGSNNTASGASALYGNTIGNYNTASGYNALAANVNNHSNTAVGYQALRNTSASDNNTAVGANAGHDFNNGYNNVFLGANVDVNQSDLFNVIAVGQGTVVGASSTARFGNSSTVSYGGWAGWTNVSDGRYKKNVRENVPGMEFIKKLRPITYTLDAAGLEAFYRKNQGQEGGLAAAAKAVQEKALQEKGKIVQTGFVAQEVEAAARELGFDFSGVDAAKNEFDTYGLRYAEFVVPLVKAVQELDKQNKELASQNKELAARMEQLESLLQSRSNGESLARR